MKSTQRQAVIAVATVALSLVGTPVIAQSPQRGGPAGPDTPRLILSTFHSDDHKLAVNATEEFRNHLMDEFRLKELYVLTQKDINNTLEQSGYKADSALSTNDLMELSKQLRGDETLDGTVTKTATGVHEQVQLLLKRNNTTLAQPLPAVDAKDPGDAAKQLTREYQDVRKSLEPYKACENDLRAAKYPEAEADARKTIAAYANSTLGRVCLLSAYLQDKAAPDSIIGVANQILAYDPKSVVALSSAIDAYKAKGDTASSINYSLRLYRADPTNTALANAIINELATSGAPEKAIPIVDSLLVDNPGDPEMLRTKWLLMLHAGAAGSRDYYKQALQAGEVYVKADTSAANLDYFQKQIAAAQADSNVAAMQEYAAKAEQKFPKEISFPLLLAQNYNKAGQLQQALEQARKASAIDPKNLGAWQYQIYLQNQMKQPDSVLATAAKAIQAGAPKDSIAPQLIALVKPALDKAQASNTREDWQSALNIAQAVDSVAPGPMTKYIAGASAFSIGLNVLQEVQTLQKTGKKDDKAKACDELKVADSMFTTAQIDIPAGGAFAKESANTLMGQLQQYSPYVDQFKKALKCK